MINKNSEIIQKMSKYRYPGFINYLMKYSEEIRTLFIAKTMHVTDLATTTLSNGEIENDSIESFDLNVVSQLGESFDFILFLAKGWDDWLFNIEIQLDEIDGEPLGYLQSLQLSILCDSPKPLFPQYSQGFSGMKTSYYPQKEGDDTEKVHTHFRLTYIQLDHIMDALNEDMNDFDRVMYLFKYNEEMNHHYMTDHVKKLHKDYLNSEDYVKDYQREVRHLEESYQNYN